ncbi:MAG: histidine kinase dimerization/phosphoacceptor domain -containing protein [Spirochaetaceae bacterium]
MTKLFRPRAGLCAALMLPLPVIVFPPGIHAQVAFGSLESVANYPVPTPWVAGGLLLAALIVGLLAAAGFRMRKPPATATEDLSLVLGTIQKLNHMAADAGNEEELAGHACDIIVGTGACEKAWISLTDATGTVWATLRATRGTLSPPSAGEPHTLREPLEHHGRLYGYLILALPQGGSLRPGAAQLFTAAADEIAYGLHGLYLSRERDRLQGLLEDAMIIVESSPMVLFRWNARDGWPVDYVSGNIRRFGYEPAELTSGAIVYRDLVYPGDRDYLEKKVAQHFRDAPGNFVTRYRVVRADGAVRWVEDRTTISVDEIGSVTKLEGIVFDVTDEVESRERLKAAVKQRETLLQELYHRTKNNMQVIASMVALRNMSVTDPQAQGILREIENKIYAMALVHSKLYQSGDISQLSLDEYLAELAQLVLESHEDAAERITVSTDTEPVSCLIDTAVPLGLVVAELLTNSLKHAFPDRRPGRLALRLRRSDSGEIILKVRDNGVGFPAGASPTQPDTLGLQTVRHIVELQLGGSLRAESSDGILWHLAIPPETYDRRV